MFAEDTVIGKLRTHPSMSILLSFLCMTAAVMRFSFTVFTQKAGNNRLFLLELFVALVMGAFFGAIPLFSNGRWFHKTLGAIEVLVCLPYAVIMLMTMILGLR